MYSKLLYSKGLKNNIANIKYDFKYKNNDTQIEKYLNDFLDESNFKPNEIYTAHQAHTNKVVEATSGEDFVYGKIIRDVDGLITNRINVGLIIKFADCTPILFYDPIKKVQASVHSGWRGTSKKIAEVAIENLVHNYNSTRSDICAYIGPTIDFDKFEVGSEVYDAFINFKSRDKFFIRASDKFKLNLSLANKLLLKENGLLEENIEIAKECTYSNNKLHSARREGEDYGLNSIISIIGG